MYARPSGIVTLTTDFGWVDPYVGIMKGALFDVAPRPTVVDISHDVPPQDIGAGAFFMWSLIDRFVDGTVHVGVVDPGVGGSRRALAVAARGQYWLAPDNGLLSAVIAMDPAAEVRALDLEQLRIRREAVTFDGRDVFAPVAAMISSGRYGFSALGPRVTDAVSGDVLFEGEGRVAHVDRYGNCITNLRGPLKLGEAVQIGGRQVRAHRTYSDVAPGELLAYMGSFGLVEVAARDGSAQAILGSRLGDAVSLVTPKPAP